MVHLYIKIHDSGLKYFGRTINDPYKYKGSGTHWKRHIKKYGNNVKTIIIASFEEGDPKLQQYAESFSVENDIVKSREWANKIPEAGVQEYHSSVINYYSDSELIEISKRFNTIKELRDFSGSVYGTILSRGLKQRCFSHMEKLRYDGITDEELQNIALKYTTIKDFKDGEDGRYYSQSLARGILSKITPHIKRRNEKITQKDYNEAIDNCKYLTDFRTNYNSLYVISKKSGVFEEITKNLIKTVVQWTDETAVHEAKKYNTKSEFFKNSGGAYNYLKRNGLYETSCSHMKRKKDGIKK